MARVGPPAAVDAPLLAPPATGLLTVSRVLRDNAVQNREEGGVLLAPEGCGQWSVYDPCDFQAGEPGENPGLIYSPPFIIEAEDVCASGGGARDLEGRARRLLETVTPAAVERELWDGPIVATHAADADGVRWFGDGTATVVSGTLVAPDAVSPRLGLALLEEYLGDTASRGLGVIHATRATASLLSYASPGQVNPLTRTQLGSLFAIGSGYSGAGPDGDPPPAGQRWMYATDPIEVRLHAPVVTDRSESIGRGHNDLRTYARRTASLASSWCRLGAVLVDLTAA